MTLLTLNYPQKQPNAEILQPPTVPIAHVYEENNDLLILGDNLLAMQHLIFNCALADKVDLVYIDPPFSSQNTFTLGADRVSTISRRKEDPIAYHDQLKGLDFIEFLRQRFLLIHKLLSPQGSLYVHIDQKLGHYIKVVLDEIFGPENFRNDITRIKCNPKNFKRKAFGNVKDVIYFYTKSEQAIWNEPFEQMTEKQIQKLYHKIDKNGQRYTTVPLHAPGETKSGNTGQEWRGMKPPPGRHWRSSPAELELLEKQGFIEWSKNGVPRKKIYAHQVKGKKKQDIWEYKDKPYPQYPTEKNNEMLQMIVEASSNPDSLVMDCFCGSGSTLLAASLQNRSFIGIDNSPEAIEITQKKLAQAPRDLFNTEKKPILWELP